MREWTIGRFLYFYDRAGSPPGNQLVCTIEGPDTEKVHVIEYAAFESLSKLHDGLNIYCNELVKEKNRALKERDEAYKNMRAKDMHRDHILNRLEEANREIERLKVADHDCEVAINYNIELLTLNAKLTKALKDLIESEAQCNFKWTSEHANAWGNAIRILENK